MPFSFAFVVVKMNDHYTLYLKLMLTITAIYYPIIPIFSFSVVCLRISTTDDAYSSCGRMHCHFDNDPEDRPDRSVMITLKFNDYRSVIRAHGHLDGCSHFLKVNLGIRDQQGGERRFSCGKHTKAKLLKML